MSEPARIGLLGGTFDPFHRGHLEPVQDVCDEMQWDLVLYVPAYRQPFKSQRSSESPFHRYAMCVLGCEDDPRLKVTTLELERGALSYTVETLEELRNRYRSAVLDWIIGEDSLDQLMQWRSIGRIFELANFVVLRRGGESVPEMLKGRLREAATRGRSGSLVVAANRRLPVSSTEIRERLGRGETISDLVPPRVASYIQKYGLYESEVTI
ncbi:MAG: nicotinate-nucleotide adenylyltransferase [Thermoanaerobaculia bacterium]